jgi:hypothetical protein
MKVEYYKIIFSCLKIEKYKLEWKKAFGLFNLCEIIMGRKKC